MSELLIDTRIEAMPRPRLRGAARARRCSTLRFTLWMVPWFALVAIGLFAAVQCLVGGLHHTNMDNRYPFGLWIFLDLTVIALGAGAFTTGLLAYVFRWREVRAVLHLAVLTGLICYGGAIAILLVDVGQPLRAWFTFWHPNVHSMLAEVTFCLTCYLLVLAVEAIPVLARNRKWRRNDLVAAFGSRVHHGMVVLAVLGATLSFFHQGSLGGLYGVLQGRPFAYREVLWIFPTTFFLFVLSAMAVGPSFLLLVTRACEAVARRSLVPGAVLERLARLSGSLLMVYLLLKAVDTLVWLNRTVPAAGEHPARLFGEAPFDSWVLALQFVAFGLVPAVLLRRAGRIRSGILTLAAVLACAGIAVDRLVATLQTLFVPTLPFEQTWLYWPNWQEVTAFLAVIALGVIVLSLAHRAEILFPAERELDPTIDPR